MSRKDKAILVGGAAVVVAAAGRLSVGVGLNPWLVMPGMALYIAVVLFLCLFLGFNDRRPR